MQGAFATVVWIVSAIGVVGALVALALSRRTWDRYGSDHLVLDSEPPSRRQSSASVDRDEEIRDMVIARNHRRARRGESALDVDAEVERQIAELSPPIK